MGLGQAGSFSPVQLLVFATPLEFTCAAPEAPSTHQIPSIYKLRGAALCPQHQNDMELLE